MTRSITIAALALLLLATGTNGLEAQQRQRFSMDPGWLFAPGDHLGAERVDFDDDGWRRLDLPHDWSIEGRPDQNAPGAGRVGYFPTGVGWYRKHFRLPAGADGRRVWIEFDGIYEMSDVWINDHHLGNRPFGYVGFRYDVTGLTEPGVNVIAVRVDNSNQPNSRWYSGSGIYRHAWLTLVAPLHVGHWGTFVTSPDAAADAATLAIRTRVENHHPEVRTGVLRSTVLDAHGRALARTEAPFTIDGGGELELDQRLTLASPRLWSIETPNLYSLRSELLEGGRVEDDHETTFGVRTIDFDADRGFLLNGERVKMLGVNLHHDGGAVGAAVPERVWERRLEILKEMGVNAIRTAHNPMAPEFLQLTDRMGFLVMNESFDEWTVAKVEHGYNRHFEAWSERDLTDFIRRDRNHPSVVIWSVGNEIGEQTRSDGHLVLRRLLEIAHREDPTRPVTTGNDQIAADNRSATLDFLGSLDVVGYNYVDRWRERRELFAAEDRHRHPDWKMIGTENVAVRGPFGGSYSLGDDPTVVRPNYTTGMIRAAELWKWVARNDYFAGDFMWTGIDYLGEARWPAVGAAAGPIDITGHPKDAFHFYRSQWTDQPVLHLFPHWNWPGREGQLIPVLAYTNCNAVELFHNGRSLGEKRVEFPRQGTAGGWNTYERPVVNPTTTDLHLSWDVPYEPGQLRAVGRRDGETACEAEVRTAGAPAAIRLTVDRDPITADPRDVAHVRFEIVDGDGVVVPTADALVRFTVTGGEILAVDNGDLRDHDPYLADRRRAFNGRGLVILRAREPGLLRLSASSEALADAALEISVKAGHPVPVVESARE